MKFIFLWFGMRNIGERRVAGGGVLANLSPDFLTLFLPARPFAWKVIETSAQISSQWVKVALASFCLVPKLLEANMSTQYQMCGARHVLVY